MIDIIMSCPTAGGRGALSIAFRLSVHREREVAINYSQAQQVSLIKRLKNHQRKNVIKSSNCLAPGPSRKHETLLFVCLPACLAVCGAVVLTYAYTPWVKKRDTVYVFTKYSWPKTRQENLWKLHNNMIVGDYTKFTDRFSWQSQHLKAEAIDCCDDHTV